MNPSHFCSFLDHLFPFKYFYRYRTTYIPKISSAALIINNVISIFNLPIIFTALLSFSSGTVVKSKSVCRVPSGIIVDNYAARRAACSSAIK